MRTHKSFKDALKSKEPILLDGATGTELYNRGVFINRCFEDANLRNPELILGLHQDYLAAGSQAISTNSWGANRAKLQRYNLHDKVHEINAKAANLAKKASEGQDAWISGSIGPLGVALEPWGPTSLKEAFTYFEEQASALAEGGVDLFSLETFSNIPEIQQAILACRAAAPDTPIIAQLVINPDGKSIFGSPIQWAISKLDEWNVDVVGLNCSVGPQPMLSCIKQIKEVTNKPICFQPNAGLPKEVDGRQIYMSTPEYMAHFTTKFLEAGVQIVGGCCGTSPQHIRAMNNAVRHDRSKGKIEKNQAPTANFLKEKKISQSNNQDIKPVPEEQKSNWAKKIAQNKKVFTIELLSPQGVKTNSIIEKATALKAANIDCINIPDGPRASSRMSAMLTAVMLEQKVNIETIVHYCCRDRNLLGMQSDMLGAHAIGLRNVLAITGDPPKTGNYPDVTAVFDIDSIGLTNMINRLNQGYDVGGQFIGEPTALSIGVGVNPIHRDFDYEMNRFKWKVKAGASWAISQPIFDITAMYKFLEYINKHDIAIPIIAGIWPLLSYKNALFMNNEVPGVVIPNDIMEKMSKVKDPEDAKKMGVEIAYNMVEALGNDINGVQVSAPFGRIDLALKVLGQ